MALPKYPQLKSKIEDMLLERFNKVSREVLGPLAKSPRIIQQEGRILKHNTIDNLTELESLDYQEMIIEYKFENSKVPDMTPEDVIKIVDNKAKELGGQQAKYSYKKISDVAVKTGNVVNAGGKVSVDVFIKMLETISLDFDKNGSPKMPTMVIHPDQAEQWKRVIEEAATPEIDEKIKAIIARKKKEYDAEQASRKLVN